MIIYWEKLKSQIPAIVDYKIRNASLIKDRPKYANGERISRTYLIIGAGFDIETSVIKTEKFEAAYCYHWAFSLDEYTIGGRTLDSMMEFFELLLSTIPENLHLLVLDANLGYEFQFCKRKWFQLGMSNLFAKEKRNPLKIDIGEKIEMREVLGLFGRNLAQIGENYCTIRKLKGDLDYSKVRLSNTPMSYLEQCYCENDVQILSQLGRYIFTHFFGRNPSLPMTKTGIIRTKVKSKLGKSLKFEKERIQNNLPDEELYNLFRNYLFKGGICGTNSRYMNKVLNNVRCADYTSDYPACMNHYKYPDGYIEEIPTDEFMGIENVPYIAIIEFHDMISKTTHSLLSSHKALDFVFDPVRFTVDNGRIFSADKITFVVNDVEFRAIAKAYDFSLEKTKIIRCWRFEKYVKLPHHLLDVLNEEYLTKEELKATGKKDTIEYADSKAVVNGTFGMTCTSIFTEDWTFDGCEIEPKRDEEGNIVKRPYDEAIKSMFLNPFWGFWITSYARSLLMDVITQFPDCIVQYDTDSIYYLKDHPQSKELEKFIVDYNNEIYHQNNVIFNGNHHFRDLGAWDLEEPFKRFKGLGSKRYMYETHDGKIKQVVAGCRKGTIQRQFEFEKERGFSGDIFDFFNNHMIVDKEHSQKLASLYIDEYEVGEHTVPEIIVDYKDYNENTETIKLECCTVLKPVEFNMSVTPEHLFLAMTIQSLYRNANSASEICKIYEKYVLENKNRRKKNGTN